MARTSEPARRTPSGRQAPVRRQSLAAARREHAAERTRRLQVYRGVFALLALALLALAGISGAAEVPFEPYLALFFSSFGMVMIFSIKIWETK